MDLETLNDLWVDMLRPELAAPFGVPPLPTVLRNIIVPVRLPVPELSAEIGRSPRRVDICHLPGQCQKHEPLLPVGERELRGTEKKLALHLIARAELRSGIDELEAVGREFRNGDLWLRLRWLDPTISFAKAGRQLAWTQG